MEGTEMSPRRKTVPSTPKHSRSSSSGRGKLIAKEKDEKQSAKKRTALDNRFHRTPETERALEDATVSRGEHPQREIGSASFKTSLGFGCIAYSDLDESG